MKSTCLLLFVIAVFSGCKRSPEVPLSHKSADSLLGSFVLAQSNPNTLKNLCYKPETVEAFGQDWESFVQLLCWPDLNVRDSSVQEFGADEEPLLVQSHNGVTARATPSPLGWLVINFENENGVTDRYTKVMYGKTGGNYFISTYQRVENAE